MKKRQQTKRSENKLKSKILVPLVFVLCSCFLAGIVSAEENSFDPIGELPGPIVYDFSVIGHLSDTNDFLNIDVLSTPNCESGKGLIDLSVIINDNEVYSAMVPYSAEGETVGLDISRHLMPGNNKVYISIDSSNVDYQDSNPSNDVFELSFEYDLVSEPDFITDITVSDLKLEKDGSKGAIVSFTIEETEGNDLLSGGVVEEVVIEIYDKWERLVYYEVLHNVELSCDFSVSSSEFYDCNWSDLMGMTAKVYVPGEENMEDNLLNK